MVDTDQLVTDHLWLAQSLALQVWRTAPHALELDELKAIANLGLVSAAARWEPYCAEHDYSPAAVHFFKPFAARRVQGAIRDAIRAADWANRQLRSRSRALQAAGQDTGATAAELAARTGLSPTEIHTTRRGMARRPISLEAEEIDPDSDQDVESTVVTASVLRAVVAAIRTLPPEEQIVVALHYYRGMFLRQVAIEMSITESRVLQLHARAVLTVHEAMLRAVTHTES